MGTYAEVLVRGGDDGLAGWVEGRLTELEERWSRFRPDSELSRLNAAGGAPCVVSADTIALVDAMRQASDRTAGRFDPTLHDALVGLGYATGWVEGMSAGEMPAARSGKPIDGHGCEGIEIAPRAGIVRLPPWVRLDPGGLGKGLAADLVAAELLDRGAEGVLVNVGGDLRAAGEPPPADDGGARWTIEVEAPELGAASIGRIELVEGGIATSTSARRRWTTSDGHVVHHIVDPATGLPSETSRVQVTVVAGSAWWAEVLATVAFLDGRLDDPHAAAIVVDDTGRIDGLGDVARWFRTLP